MNTEFHQKVNAGHLRRGAFLYVRQSTPRQVLENTESTKRQYALRQRAVAWVGLWSGFTLSTATLGMPVSRRRTARAFSVW
jgi:hypothetical protein